MSFSVRRNFGDQRQLREFAKPLMALVDMIADGDWERAVRLADSIAQDCRVNLILEETSPKVEVGVVAAVCDRRPEVTDRRIDSEMCGVRRSQSAATGLKHDRRPAA